MVRCDARDTYWAKMEVEIYAKTRKPSKTMEHMYGCLFLCWVVLRT